MGRFYHLLDLNISVGHMWYDIQIIAESDQFYCHNRDLFNVFHNLHHKNEKKNP